MRTLLARIGYGLQNAARFSGRDGGVQFWTYALVVVALGITPFFIYFTVEIQRSFQAMQAFAAAHPEQSTAVSGPGHYSVQIEGHHTELFPDVESAMIILAVSAVLMVLLLAAAVVRRLHDRNKSGFWGLMPLPFLGIGLYAATKMFAAFGKADTAPDMTLFGLLFLNNFIYIGTLIALAIMLMLPGTTGSNRYGPDWKPVGE
jgi:uncharacterized membrane protein YhaH (DUF805 family)